MILSRNALCKVNNEKSKKYAMNTKTEVKPRFLVVLVETTGYNTSPICW